MQAEVLKAIEDAAADGKYLVRRITSCFDESRECIIERIEPDSVRNTVARNATVAKCGSYGIAYSPRLQKMLGNATQSRHK